jgi:hypothetical protein
VRYEKRKAYQSIGSVAYSHTAISTGFDAGTKKHTGRPACPDRLPDTGYRILIIRKGRYEKDNKKNPSFNSTGDCKRGDKEEL